MAARFGHCRCQADVSLSITKANAHGKLHNHTATSFHGLLAPGLSPSPFNAVNGFDSGMAGRPTVGVSCAGCAVVPRHSVAYTVADIVVALVGAIIVGILT